MPDALLLCAGRGERLRPLTDTCPKPLVSDGSETLVDRHLRRLAAAGVTRVVINLGWLPERLVEHVGDGSRFGVSVLYSPEGHPALDSGGGIRRALPLLDDSAPFWVVNGDIWTDYPFTEWPGRVSDNDPAALVLVSNPAYRDDGDFVLRGDRVVAEHPAPLTFTGIAAYRHAFFDACTQTRFSVVPMLRAAAGRGALGGEWYRGDWFDVGTAERLARVRAHVRERAIPDRS